MQKEQLIKEKAIETEELKIQGNVMWWHGTMVQLSNVSCISARGLAVEPFPKYAIVGIFIALVLFSINALVAVILLCAMGIWIYYWYQQKQVAESMTSLNILMNSGNTLQIIIRNKNFLQKVLTVLEKIMIDGGVGTQQIAINIKGCNISGNAKVLDDLKINS